MEEGKTAIVNGRGFKAPFLAVLSGLLLTASFPNIGLSWIAWFALVPLLAAIGLSHEGDSFRLGFIAGLSHYFTLIYWLVHTMQTYGYLPWYVSVAVLVVVASYGSVYLGAFSYLLKKTAPPPASLIWQVPVFWVTIEFLRSKLFTGMPWELIGYSQHDLLPILQWADLFGIYGISFVVALGNGAVFVGYLFLRNRDWFNRRVSPKVFGASILCAAAVVASVWLYGVKRLHRVDALISRAPKANIAVIQGNVDQAIKWDPAFQTTTTQKYIGLSESILDKNPDLIVWPETATPFYFLADAEPSERVIESVLNTGKDFLFGSPSYVSRRNGVDYHNSAYLILGEGAVAGKYDKVHLVPFGEYVPLKQWLPFIGKLVAQVGDFKPGKEGRLLPWRELNIGMQICYEIIFPKLAREMVRNGADVLVNITNDAWFGRTAAPFQHFSMAALRAVENRRTLVRAANTGISGFVDPAGRVLAVTPLFEEKALSQTVPILKIKTLYSRYGDILPIACLAGSILLWIIRFRSELRFRR